eukprot:SAG11_NODE_135_length_15131_cov_9.906599_9_plen_173_part_00
MRPTAFFCTLAAVHTCDWQLLARPLDRQVVTRVWLPRRESVRRLSVLTFPWGGGYDSRSSGDRGADHVRRGTLSRYAPYRFLYTGLLSVLYCPCADILVRNARRRRQELHAALTSVDQKSCAVSGANAVQTCTKDCCCWIRGQIHVEKRAIDFGRAFSAACPQPHLTSRQHA